ncbi:MAG: TonB-dependent receptor, partial [Thermoanaerobaculia bacterium]
EFEDQIVITAARTERQMREVPVNITIVDSQDIELSPALTTDDLLRQIPGFNLLQQGSSRVMHPAVQSLSIRGVGGSSASRTLVLLDGIPMNDPFGGWIYWNRIPLGQIERVEVVRGGGASVWGNGALGGVVHLITKKPTRQTFAFDGQLGNNHTYQGTVSGSGGGEDLTVDGFADVFVTDGYSRIEPSVRGPIDVPQSSEHLSGSLRVSHRPSDSISWSAQGSYYEEERVNGTPQNQNESDNQKLQADLQWVRPSDALWQFELYFEDQHFSQVLTSVNLERTMDFPTLDQFDVPSSAQGASAQLTKMLGDSHLLNTGADLRALNGKTNERARFIDGEPTRQRSAGGDQQFAGLFLRDLISVGERLRLDLGFRIDFWELKDGDLVEGDLETGEMIRRVDFEDRSKELFNPTLGFTYAAGGRTTLRGSAYSAFRAPTISELYRPFVASNNRYTAPNSDLDPETLTGVETGVDYSFTARTYGRATVFWNEIENAIADVTIGSVGPEGGELEPCGMLGPSGVCRQRSNVGTIENLGLELELSSRPWNDWSFGASYLYDDNEVVEAPGRPDLVGNRARQVAVHQGTVRAAYTNPGLLNASLLGRYVGDRFDDDQNRRPVDSFFVVDLMLERQILPPLGVKLSVENLLDERIEISASSLSTNVGHPRLYRLGLAYRFGN